MWEPNLHITGSLWHKAACSWHSCLLFNSRSFAMDMHLAKALHPDGPAGTALNAGNTQWKTGSAAKLTIACLLAGNLLIAPLTHSNEVAPHTPDLPSANNAAPTSRLLDRARQLEDYRSAIARVEAEQGAWGAGLAEQLSGLGETYQVRGQHRDAIEIFDRAIHVSRINNGLYDLGQVPIIDRLLESLMARGQWEEVHKRHQYLYWLHKRNFGADDPRMLPVIDRLGKWYLNDYALNPNRRMMGQLVDAHNLFQQAIFIIDGTYGQEDLRLIEPLRGIVMSNWFFYNYTGGSSGISAMERDQFTRDIGPDQTHFVQDQNARYTQYMRNNYADGKQALVRMVEIYSKSPDAPPGAAAQAKIELADWEQLFDRRRAALALYEQAYQELMSDEKTRHLAHKAFAQPVALPALDLVEAEVASESDGESNEQYVVVSFNVNRFGRAERVEVIETSPEGGSEHRTRIRRNLESTQFRPRMVDGVAVETPGLTQRYLVAGK